MNECCAVRTASYRIVVGFKSGKLYRTVSNLDYLKASALPPISSRFRAPITESKESIFSAFFVYVFDRRACPFESQKTLCAVVSYDIEQVCVLDIAAHFAEVEEAAYPSVSHGVSVPGRREFISIATREAFIMRFFASPGWILKPFTSRAEAEQALKFSYTTSPSVPPSTV